MTLIVVNLAGEPCHPAPPPANPFVLPYSWGMAAFSEVVNGWMAYGKAQQTVALLTAQLAAMSLEQK